MGVQSAFYAFQPGSWKIPFKRPLFLMAFSCVCFFPPHSRAQRCIILVKFLAFHARKRFWVNLRAAFNNCISPK